MWFEISGLKTDLSSEAKITKDQVKKFCKEKNLLFFFTSSKDNKNIKEVFNPKLFILLDEGRESYPRCAVANNQITRVFVAVCGGYSLHLPTGWYDNVLDFRISDYVDLSKIILLGVLYPFFQCNFLKNLCNRSHSSFHEHPFTLALGDDFPHDMVQEDISRSRLIDGNHFSDDSIGDQSRL